MIPFIFYYHDFFYILLPWFLLYSTVMISFILYCHDFYIILSWFILYSTVMISFIFHQNPFNHIIVGRVFLWKPFRPPQLHQRLHKLLHRLIHWRKRWKISHFLPSEGIRRSILSKITPEPQPWIKNSIQVFNYPQKHIRWNLHSK